MIRFLVYALVAPLVFGSGARVEGQPQAGDGFGRGMASWMGSSIF
jgi:hypothetical protein